jgi:hypothetical protein
MNEVNASVHKKRLASFAKYFSGRSDAAIRALADRNMPSDIRDFA